MNDVRLFLFMIAGLSALAWPWSLDAQDILPDTVSYSVAALHFDVLRDASPEGALSFGEAMLVRAENEQDTEQIGSWALRLGTLQRHRAAFDAAMERLDQAQAAFQEIGDLEQEVEVLLQHLFVVKDQGEFVEAMVVATEAIRLSQSASKPGLLGRSYTEFADVLYYQQQHAEAARYCSLAVDVLSSTDNLDGLALAHQYLGENLLILGDHEDALEQTNRSIALREQLGPDALGMARLYNARGNIHKFMASYDAAVADYDRSLALLRPLNLMAPISATQANIADIFIRQDRYREALPYVLEAIDIQESTNFIRHLDENYYHASLVYESLGEPDEALAYYKKYVGLRDSLLSSERDLAMEELRTQYEVEQQQATILLQDERIARQRLTQRVSLGFGGLALLVLGGLYVGYRAKRNANEQLTVVNTKLQHSLEQLRQTQAQLVHAEKMASLGALTAGIAHEIKNPLNFINNFAALNAELADELLEAVETGEDTEGVLADLRMNTTKIEHHGKRADLIVKSMMAHARTGEGKPVSVDLNRLVDEHVHLAYHGKRALVADFSVVLKTSFAPDVGDVVVVPQDIGRVILNIASNAFDALLAAGVPQPEVYVQTTRIADLVEIRIADNGPGIAPSHLDHIFEPFFTTKPTGQGTGLGLSMSYEIITQGHGGTLTVESVVGQGATFVIMLPDIKGPRV